MTILPNSHKTKNWYAVYVRSRAEKKVASLFEKSGIEFWLPIVKKLHQWSDRKKWVDVPVISGYCFIKEYESKLFSVLNTDHVAGFVKFEGKPCIIHESQIELFKKLIQQTEYPWEITIENPKPGQKIRIISGPLIGFEAELINFKNKKVVCVRIDHINNSIVVNIPLHDIHKIE